MKTLKKIFGLLMALLLTLSTVSMAACKPDSGIDSSKIQVYVYVVSDGYGYNYMEKLVKDWNDMHPDSDYQFVWTYGQDSILRLPSQLESDTCTDKNLYVGPSSSFLNMIMKDQLIDLSDVYEMEPDGAGNGKIKDKVLNYDKLKEGYSDYLGNGMYAIPHAQAISSAMVFDFDHFLRKGYLNYASESELVAVNAQVAGAAKIVSGSTLDVSKYKKVAENVLIAEKDFGNYVAGDVILTAGKDGKYGTYDDGQVTTVEEFYDLLRKITVADYAFIYTTQYATANTPSILYHLLYQTLGYENVKVFESFKGTLKDKEGNPIELFDNNGNSLGFEVNLDNAYAMWNTELVQNAYNQAAKFFDNTILGHLLGNNNVGKMLNTRTYDNGPTTSTSHTDAQRGFALDHYDKGDEYGKESAFLIDGAWWENESKGVLSQLAGYGPNAAEHRFYLTPYAEGTVGNMNETLMQGSAGSSCMIYLNNYPKKVVTAEQKQAYDNAVKEFVAYTCSDEALNYYTATHGLKAYFDYELTPETKAKLTPFQKNTFEMLADTEHIKIVDGTTLGVNKNLIRAYMELNDRASIKNNIPYENPYTAMYGMIPAMSWTEYYSCVRDNIIKEYSGKLSAVKEYLKTLN